MFSGRLSALFLLFFVGLLSIGGVSARPSKVLPTNAFAQRAASLPSRELRTNAERLAVGLPPLKPRQLFTPTRLAARIPEPSPLPPVTGRILVRKASTREILGFVSNAVDNSGRYNLDTHTDSTLHLHVRFSPYSSSTTPFNMGILPDGGDYPFLGFSGKNSDLNGPTHNVGLIATKQTPVGSTPSKVGTSAPGNNDASESQIWFYDSSTQKLKTIWVNTAMGPGGSTTLQTEFYAPSGGPGGGSASGILIEKSGGTSPSGYQKVTLEISP